MPHVRWPTAPTGSAFRTHQNRRASPPPPAAQSLPDHCSWSPCFRPHIWSTLSRWRESLRWKSSYVTPVLRTLQHNTLREKPVSLTAFKAKHDLMLLPLCLCPQVLPHPPPPQPCCCPCSPERARQMPHSLCPSLWPLLLHTHRALCLPP